MKRNLFTAANLVYLAIMAIGMAYLNYFDRNTNPRIPSELRREVEREIGEEGRGYLDQLPIYDPSDTLKASEPYRVTKLSDQVEYVLIDYHHGEIKDFIALLSFGHYGKVESVVAFGTIGTGFEPNVTNQP